MSPYEAAAKKARIMTLKNVRRKVGVVMGNLSGPTPRRGERQRECPKVT